MKRMGLGLGCGVFLAVILFSCGSENFCPDLDAGYLATKTVTSLYCEKNGNKVPIDNPDAVMPLTTALQISQGGCDIWGNENVWRHHTFISYRGTSKDDDQFSLEINNSDNVSIPMNFKIGGSKVKCRFNGEIKWDGDSGDTDLLKGEIYYNLTRRPNEHNKSCPDSCAINMTFIADQVSGK